MESEKIFDIKHPEVDEVLDRMTEVVDEDRLRKIEHKKTFKNDRMATSSNTPVTITPHDFIYESDVYEMSDIDTLREYLEGNISEFKRSDFSMVYNRVYSRFKAEHDAIDVLVSLCDAYGIEEKDALNALNLNMQNIVKQCLYRRTKDKRLKFR